MEPATKPLVPAMRWLLYTAAVLVLLAGLQLFVFTERSGTFFAWTIADPLAAAFLGGAYWAAVAIEALAAHQQIWANARIAVPTVLVFTVLTLIGTLLNRDKLHLGDGFAVITQAVTGAWLTIYVLVPLLLVLVVIVQARTPGSDPPRLAPLPGWICAVLVIQAIVLLGTGVAMFALPDQANAFWPWRLTPFMAQATGVWLISLGVAAAHALYERDARRLRPAAAGYVLLAVLQFIALARYPDLFEWGSAAGIIYLIALGTMLVVGSICLILGRPRTYRPHLVSSS